jgi:hypothetical protein
VCDKQRWADLLSRYDVVADGADQINQRAVFDLLDKLAGLTGERNFEDYIEIIDKIASYGFDRSDRKILHAVIKLLGGLLDCYPMHTWTKAPFLARQLIAEEVGRAHETSQRPSYRELAALYGQFLQYLLTNAEISLVSFNCDDVLLDALSIAGVSLEDGFVGDRFDASAYLMGRSVLGFPHGHARFILEGQGIRRYESIPDANTKRMDNLRGGVDETRYLISSPNCYTFNTFMVTGRDKDSSFNLNPFAAYYQRLAHDLLTAKLVIVIGHSLQDAHINRLLVNFLGLSQDRRILIVDFDSAPVDVVAGFMNPTSSIHRLLDVVGITGLPLDWRNQPYKYKWQDEVDKINQVGVGTLYPQITYWKKGFEDFLGDFRNTLQAECSL